MDLLEHQKKMGEIIAVAMEAVESRLVKAKVDSIGKDLSKKQFYKIESEASHLMKVIFEYYFSSSLPINKSFNDLINEQCEEFSKKEIDLS